MKKIIIILLVCLAFTACDNRRNVPVNNSWANESYDDGAYMDNGGGYYNTTNNTYYNRGGQVMTPTQRTHYISNRNQYNARHEALRKQHLAKLANERRLKRNEQARNNYHKKRYGISTVQNKLSTKKNIRII